VLSFTIHVIRGDACGMRLAKMASFRRVVPFDIVRGLRLCVAQCLGPPERGLEAGAFLLIRLRM
jgi:hypothetical protein